MSTFELFPEPVEPIRDAPLALFALCELCDSPAQNGSTLCAECDTAEYFDFPEMGTVTFAVDGFTIKGAGDYLVCWHGLGNGDVRRYRSAFAAETAAATAIAELGQRLREHYDGSIEWPSCPPPRDVNLPGELAPGELLSSPWSGHEFRLTAIGSLAGHREPIWSGRGVQHVRADIDGSPTSFTLAYWPDMTADERALLPGSGRRTDAKALRAMMRDAFTAPAPTWEQPALIA